MSAEYVDYWEGTLRAALDTSTTTGVTVKLKKVNDVYPSAPTTAFQIMVVQQTRTQTKVEKMNVASGTSYNSTTGVATLGTLTRAISLSDGTDTSGTGTAQSFTQGASVYISWTTSDAEQAAMKDESNTFTADQLISSTNELQFNDSNTAIWDDGTTLRFKSSSQGSVTLDTLAATGGSDEKVGVDSGATAGYIGAASSDGVLRTGDGLSYTDGGDFVTIDVTKIKDAASSELTISSGAVAHTNSHHTIDTESDAASDDLDTISGGASGDYLTIRAENDARTVVVKHGTGNIVTADNADFSLDNDDKSITLRYDGTNWREVARAGADAAEQNVTPFYAATSSGSAVGASTTSEVSVGATGNITANSLAAGDTYEIEMTGEFNVAAGSLQIIGRYSSGAGQAFSSISGITGATQKFYIKAHFTVRSIGGTGVLSGGMNFNGSTAAYTGNVETVTVDTTAATPIAIKAIFSSSNASNSIKYYTFNVKKVNAPA